MTFATKVLEQVEGEPGISDRALSRRLNCIVQQVNGECRHLAQLGKLERRKTESGILGNYPVRARPKLALVNSALGCDSFLAQPDVPGTEMADRQIFEQGPPTAVSNNKTAEAIAAPELGAVSFQIRDRKRRLVIEVVL